MHEKNKKKRKHNKEDEKFPLPIYESRNDIYKREKELPFDEMDNREMLQTVNENEIPGSDLDIPGSELDDANEAIGVEDEENNYYSLGGENHDNLEEGNADQ